MITNVKSIFLGETNEKQDERNPSQPATKHHEKQ